MDSFRYSRTYASQQKGEEWCEEVAQPSGGSFHHNEAHSAIKAEPRQGSGDIKQTHSFRLLPQYNVKAGGIRKEWRMIVTRVHRDIRRPTSM